MRSSWLNSRDTDSEGERHDYLSTIDKDGNIVSLIQSNYSGFGSGLTAQGNGIRPS